MSIRWVITLLVGFVALSACNSSHSNNNPDIFSSEGLGASSRPAEIGVTLEGGDQGREGGHFLLCHPAAGIPNSRTGIEEADANGIEKVFFVDYFLTIKNQNDRNSLRNFAMAESDALRLELVTKRLLFVFDDIPQMKLKAQRMVEYSGSFMERKGRAQWIETTQIPSQFPLTEDFTPAHLDDDSRNVVEDHCQARFFQAAVYDYSNPGQEIFYYSQFFEDHASKMQKSFRNIHELLRYMMRDETPQVIALTAYFHSKNFFFSSADEVKQRISEISKQTHTHSRFY